MKICDNNWDDPSGSLVCTRESNQMKCLAITIRDQLSEEKAQTATLTPDDCLALGIHLLMHARKNGIPIPTF